jgi:Thioredoxin like C-terminal domain
LVVVGVHTPEFSFEHDFDGVRRATEEREIDYPVAADNDYAIWSAFANHYWPALYFADSDGIVRDQHFGEGRYKQSERVIQRLLGVERELVFVEGEPPGASHGVDVDEAGNGLLRDGRMYQLARQHDAIRDRTLEITFREPGAEAYSFTFG